MLMQSITLKIKIKEFVPEGNVFGSKRSQVRKNTPHN